MLTVSISGLDELRSEWASATNRLSDDLAQAVDTTLREARGVARNSVPVRTGKLSNAIDGRVTSRGNLSASGELVARVAYASYVAEGTRPHFIRARRKSVLRFESGGRVVFTPLVLHPGTAASLFWNAAERHARARLLELAKRGVSTFCHRLST